MIAMKWSVLRRQVKRDFAAPSPPPADRFWGRFRERLQLTQRGPVGEGTASCRGGRLTSTALLRVRRALLPVLAAVVIALLLHSRRPSTLETTRGQPAARPGGAAVPLSSVEEIDVLMEYDSVIIVEDPQSRGTLVWITGANSAAPGG